MTRASTTMRVAITGASGLIGAALTASLRADGHEVVALVRRPPRPTGDHGIHERTWDPANGSLDPSALEGVDAVVNLAGAGIGDHRWTEAYQRTIRDSRVRGTELIAHTLAGLHDPPAVLLSGSAIGIYGDRGDEVLDETSPTGAGFLADVCRQWEAATTAASDAGARVAHLRSGVVLSPTGGALRKQLPLFRLGLGGRFGSGCQWQSWISLPDEVAAIRHLLTADVEGPVDLTAPNPVTNGQFTRALGAALRRPTVVAVPAFAPRLVLGRELADALLFQSQRVLPSALERSGFDFTHPTIGQAFAAVLVRTPS